MAITLSTIRQFSGSDRMILDAQGNGLQSVGVLQRLKIFFGDGEARRQNAETIRAIHNAFLNDTRFATRDLRLQATRLLEQVSTGRALDAKRMQDIVREMDRLAANSVPILEERTALHFAAVGVDPRLEDFADDVKEIARMHVVEGAAASAAANNGVVDVAQLVKEAHDACLCAILGVTGGIHHADPKLVDFVGRHLKQFVVRGDNTLRPMNEIDRRVKETCMFYNAAVRDAADHLRDGHGPGPMNGAEVAELENANVWPRMRAAFQFIDTVGTFVPASLFAKVSDYVAKVPLHDLVQLNGGSSADEIYSAFHNLAQYTLVNLIREDDGSPLFGGDSKATEAFGIYLTKLMLMRVPEDARNRICEVLKTPEAAKAFECIAREAMINMSAYEDHVTTTRIVALIEESVGREFFLPGETNNEPKGAHRRGGVRRSELDMTGFSTAVRIAYDAEKTIVGNSAARVRTALLDPLKSIFTRMSLRDFDGFVNRRLANGARAVLDGILARNMKTLSADITAAHDGVADPGGPVELPGGVTLLGGRAAVRDALACLVAGRDDATFAQLDVVSKARVNVLLVLVSSDAAEAAELGLAAALSADGRREAIRADGAVGRQFKITGNAADGFHVRFTSHRTPQTFTVAPPPPAAPETIAAGAGSSLDAQFDVFLSPEDMDRLATSDWSVFDPTDFDSAVVDLSLPAMDGTVPDGLRLGGTLYAAIQATI
jgi:hypothetical protein